MVVREVSVVVRVSNARVGAATSSLHRASRGCWLLQATSERVCPAPTGSEQPAESTGSAEEWCGGQCFSMVIGRCRSL